LIVGFKGKTQGPYSYDLDGLIVYRSCFTCVFYILGRVMYFVCFVFAKSTTSQLAGISHEHAFG